MERYYLRVLLLVCTLLLAVFVPTTALSQETRGAAPDEPQNLVASPQTGYILLSWSPPANTGDSSIIGYLLYKGSSPGSMNYLTEVTSTSHEDHEVMAGTTYYYQVSARNSDGEGQRSNQISASIEPQRWTVSGRVTVEGSDEGIGNANLRFQKQNPPQQSFETRTDGSGHYTIELVQDNYMVNIDADDYESREEYISVNGDQTRDFKLEDKKGGMEDFNLSKVLGIDEDQVKKAATTVITVVGIYLCSIPLMLFIVIVFLFFIFIRLGKIRKELRAKNELEGIFISKRRKKKADKEKLGQVVVRKKDVSKDRNKDNVVEKKN